MTTDLTEQQQAVDLAERSTASWLEHLEHLGGTVGQAADAAPRAAGRLVHLLRQGAGSALVEYQPGNGTRYAVVVTPLSHVDAGDGLSSSAMLEGAAFVAALPSNFGGRTVLLPAHGTVDPSYVAEKTQAGLADSIMLACLLTWFLAGGVL